MRSAGYLLDIVSISFVPIAKKATGRPFLILTGAMAAQALGCSTILGFEPGKPYPPDAGLASDAESTNDGSCGDSSCDAACTNDNRLLCKDMCCPLPPPNTTMNCDVGVCTPHCIGLTLSCAGGSIQCGSWNFESNTGEGWQPVLTQIGTASNFQIKSAPGGSLAFSFTINEPDMTHNGTSIRVPLCNGQNSSANGHWITAQVYAEGPPFVVQSNMESSVNFYWTDSGGNNPFGTQYFLFYPANSWVTVGDSTFSTISNISMDAGVAYLAVNIIAERGWVGTIYVDNIQLH